MSIKEYELLSRNINKQVEDELKRGYLSCLDIQLGGGCNARCVYCDTPLYKETCEVNLQKVEALLKSGKINYIFVCGLGEPTAPANIRYFKDILFLAEKHKAKVSAFSNCINMDKELFDYINRGVYNVIFKLDSFDSGYRKSTYRISGSADKDMQKNIETLSQIAKANKSSFTQVAASIVASNDNFDYMTDLVSFCVANNIFPKIGLLENAGNSSDTFDDKSLTKTQISQIQNFLKNEYGVDDLQSLKMCPAVLGSIFISNKDKVSLVSGLATSCKWFGLEDNNKEKQHFITEYDVEEIPNDFYYSVTDAILKYRLLNLPFVEDALSQTDKTIIGGCGGDPRQILKNMVDISYYQMEQGKIFRASLDKHIITQEEIGKTITKPEDLEITR